MVTSMAQYLGEQGLWVDQLTVLDAFSEIFGDPNPPISSNVVFADNYFQAEPFPVQPHGSAIAGAYNVDLTDITDNGLNDHEQVHTFYHGTIVPSYSGLIDGVSIDPDWYTHPTTSPRAEIGYYFSRSGGGNRAMTSIKNGLNSAFSDDGDGGRTDVVRGADGTQWPNVDYIQRTGGSGSVTIGHDIAVSFRYQDYDTGSVVPTFASYVEWFVDPDQNPYNGNSILLGTEYLPKTRDLQTRPSTVSTINSLPGTKYLYAKVNDINGHTRIAYMRDPVTFVQPPTVNPVVSPSSLVALPQRQTITITGTGFDSISTLRFNNGTQDYFSNPAYITVVSPTRIDYQIATGPNAANWKVWVRNGSIESQQFGSFTVTSAGDLMRPTAGLTWPGNGGAVQQTVINTTNRYIDVTFSDTGGSGLNTASITDTPAEFSLSGSAASAVTLTNAAPTLVSGTTYRYAFTGNFSAGLVNVNFIAGAWADLNGNLNVANMQGFSVSSDPVTTITTNVAPTGGGTVSGAGPYATGGSVTVTASPNSGFQFLNWTESGTTVAVSSSYTFIAGSDRNLTANFSNVAQTTGSIRVSIVPDAAAAAGAQWKISTESTWRNSGTIAPNLPLGTYQVEFKPISGWTTPPNTEITLNIVNPEVWVNSGAYSQTTVNPPSNLQQGRLILDDPSIR